MRAGSGFEVGAAIGEEISSRHVSHTMRNVASRLGTTLRGAAGIGGSSAHSQQADRDYQSQYLGKRS